MKRLLQFALCLFLLTCASTAATTNQLIWKHKENRVDADIRTWDLQTLLGEISEATGWEVLVEPGTQQEVNVKFSNFTIEKALPRLLGKLNYALLPQTNAPSRFCVYRTSMGRATERVKYSIKNKGEKSKHAISNELIVTLDPSSSFTIEELAKLLGAKIVGRIDGKGTYLLRFDDEEKANAARETLKENPNVANVDSNYSIDRPTDSVAFQGSAPPFKMKATAIGDPNNLIVGLIDSQVQKLDPAMEKFLLDPIRVAGEPSPTDQLSHGTSMAQTILQGLSAGAESSDTSRVKIQPVDVYGNRSTTSTFDVAAGIVQAVNKGSMVINLSLGSSGDSQLLHEVIQDSSRQGVVFFAAAGNTPVDTPTYPAAYPEVTAVTAGDRDRNLERYANFGSFVDVIGPGGSVVRHEGENFFVGGTSVATAYVSGLALGAADISGKPLPQVQTVIRQNLGFLPPKR